MDEELIAADLVQTARVLVTASGQVGERLARAQAERLRQQQNAAAEEQRELLGEQRQRETDARQRQQAADAAQARAERQAADAGRLVYGRVRTLNWAADDTQRRVGEAMVAASTMAGRDQVAADAQRYLIAETKARFGPEADSWLTTAILRWRELENERTDQASAEAAADRTPAERDEVVADREQSGAERGMEEAAGPWSDWRPEREGGAEVEPGRAVRLEAEADRQRQLVDDITADDRRDQDSVKEDLGRADHEAVGRGSRPELRLPPATTEQERAIDQVVAGTRAGYPRDAAEDHAHTATNKPTRMRRSRGAARDHSRSPGR